ncbi:MAG TPA: hypothetical protein VFY48_03810 [Solirubrobacterales bacterium]|nr:hypothetical protein [Solirubrobacterales bacterium]
MRTIPATLAVAISIVTIGAAPSAAAPATVSVRIEGESETLFEGPVLSDGHNVRAAGDTKAPAAGRRCNGLNNGAHTSPGPTPTAAAVDAMGLLGEGFDGDWYAEPFEDYFITRWGPDRQSVAAAEYWGLAVNNVFTNLGGCQQQVDSGDEVLWAYDAFANRPRLVLYPGDYDGGAVQLTAEVQLGAPLEVEVDAWDGSSEGGAPGTPQRSTKTFAGATVAPVVEGPGGFEQVDVTGAAAEVTGAGGTATFSFGTTGWHRLKATRFVAGEETVIRSNRLDVCVYEVAPSECPPLPEDDQVRVPPPYEEGEEEPEVPGGGSPGGGGQGGGPGGQVTPPAQSPAVGDAAPVRLRLLPLDRSRIDRGLVRARWRVLDAGPGIGSWTVSSLTLGRRGARYVNRASGSGGSAAEVRLPRGAGYRLRLTVTDVLGRRSSAALGSVGVPR